MKQDFLPIKRLFLCIAALFVLVLTGQANAQDDTPDDSMFNLNEVVVTGTKTPHALKDVPVQTVVITSEDIKKNASQTVSDVLRSIPGLYIVSEDIPGVSSWRSKLRGLDFNSGYGLILINGQRVKGGGMGEYGYGVNQVPLSSIERIEVIKGPGSVLYGSDALAGVINIITKATPKTPTMGIDLAAGSDGTRTGAVYGGTSVDDLGVFFNASFDQSEVGAYGYNEQRDEEYDAKRIDSRLTYEVGEKINASLILSLEDQKRTRQYKTKDVMRHNWEKKYRISPMVNVVLDKLSSASISGYYYNWNMNSMESGTDSSGFTPTMGDMYYQDVEAKYTRRFTDHYQMILGGEYIEEKLDYNLADQSIGTFSGYAQLEAGFTKALTVVLGGRYDDHEKYGRYISPKLSFMYRPAEKTTFRGSVGKGFKSPNIRQLYYNQLYQHGTYWYRSNPDLNAEESIGYSFSVEQGVLDRILCELTLFRNDIDNIVLNVDTGEIYDDLPITTFENASEAYTQGIEFSLKAILTDNLTGNISYAYTGTEDEDTGNELTYIPKNNVTVGFVYAFNPWGITFSADAQYADKMFTNSTNTSWTEDYILVDCKLSKDFGERLIVSVEGNNIFDSDYGQPDRDWLGATYLARLSMKF